MRTLIVCALAVTLVGCSHQPPSLAPSCFGTNPLACLTSVRVPIEPQSGGSASDERGDKQPRSHVHHVAHLTKKKRLKPIDVETKTTTVHRTPPVSVQADHQTTGKASEAQRPAMTEQNPATVGARTRTTQQVSAATAVAEQTSISVTSPDALVAVLMSGPDVKSVSELTGKTIAIDDRYSTSNSSVKSAVAAAGARGVELSEGKTSAINRLANKEVPAAVVALVAADAVDSFPKIAGYKVFQIPLSPHPSNQ